jgi:hypothetical protein
VALISGLMLSSRPARRPATLAKPERVRIALTGALGSIPCRGVVESGEALQSSIIRHAVAAASGKGNVPDEPGYPSESEFRPANDIQRVIGTFREFDRTERRRSRRRRHR